MHEDLIPCYRRLRELGYSRRAAFRLALWATNPDQPVNLENTK